MTHSPQAIAAYPNELGWDYDGDELALARTAFDRGRAEAIAEHDQFIAEGIAYFEIHAVGERGEWWLSAIKRVFGSALPVVDQSPTARSDSTNPTAITYSEAEFSKMMAECDEWYERLDKLIYSLATVEQIGEWSSANDPVAEFEQLIHDERTCPPPLRHSRHDKRRRHRMADKGVTYPECNDNECLLEHTLATPHDYGADGRGASGMRGVPVSSTSPAEQREVLAKVIEEAFENDIDFNPEHDYTPDGLRIADAILAAGFHRSSPAATTREWEYGIRNTASGEVGFPYAAAEIVADRSLYDNGLFEPVRRTPAGPWSPVPKGDE